MFDFLMCLDFKVAIQCNRAGTGGILLVPFTIIYLYGIKKMKTIHFSLLITMVLVSCKQHKLEKITVKASAISYNLTDGTGEYYRPIKDAPVKEKFKFIIPNKNVENIKNIYNRERLDNLEDEAEFESVDKNLIVKDRLLDIEFVFNNGHTKRIGYTGTVKDIPPKLKDVFHEIQQTTTNIRDSLKIVPVSW